MDEPLIMDQGSWNDLLQDKLWEIENLKTRLQIYRELNASCPECSKAQPEDFTNA